MSDEQTNAGDGDVTARVPPIVSSGFEVKITVFVPVSNQLDPGKVMGASNALLAWIAEGESLHGVYLTKVQEPVPKKAKLDQTADAILAASGYQHRESADF